MRTFPSVGHRVLSRKPTLDCRGWHLCDTDGMKTNAVAPSYKRHRSPAEIIAHTVWLYFRFSLSVRDVEELMAARGVILSYETVRCWTLKFGQQYADDLRRQRPQPEDKWHLDEVFLTIQGKTAYLWRAVDQHGAVLDILVVHHSNFDE